MSFVSVRTRENFSPARNVRSTTAPLSRAFSFVRTNAPPLPGLTCWNSTIRQTPPSSSMCMPFLNWFVLTVSAIANRLVDADQVLTEARVIVDASARDDDVVLDADPRAAFEIDPRLDRDDIACGQRVGRLGRHARRLVHLEAQAVAQTVTEGAGEGCPVHDAPCRSIRVDAGDPRPHCIEAGLLGGQHDLVGLLDHAVDGARDKGPGVVGGVAVHEAARGDHERLAGADLALGRARMRARGVGPGGHDALERDLMRAFLVEELPDRP